MRNANYYFCSRVPSETLSPKYTTSLNILVKYMTHLILDMYKSVHHPQTADVLSVSTGPSVVCNDVQILIRAAHETSWAQICNLCSRNFTLLYRALRNLVRQTSSKTVLHACLSHHPLMQQRLLPNAVDIFQTEREKPNKN